jgi:hypothetical protein
MLILQLNILIFEQKKKLSQELWVLILSLLLISHEAGKWLVPPGSAFVLRGKIFPSSNCTVTSESTDHDQSMAVQKVHGATSAKFPSLREAPEPMNLWILGVAFNKEKWLELSRNKA